MPQWDAYSSPHDLCRPGLNRGDVKGVSVPRRNAFQTWDSSRSRIPTRTFLSGMSQNNAPTRRLNAEGRSPYSVGRLIPQIRLIALRKRVSP